MSRKIRIRGNKNSRLHIRHRRIIVAQIIRDMQKEGEVPIKKEVILQRLESFGYGTSMSSLGRDIASIFTTNISAVLPRRSYKLNPGTRYMKVIEDEYRDESYATFFMGRVNRKATLKKRNEKIQAMLKMLGLPPYNPDDLF